VGCIACSGRITGWLVQVGPRTTFCTINHPADYYIGVFGVDVVKYLFVLLGCVLCCLDENRPKMFQMAAGFCPTSLRRAICNSLLLFVCFVVYCCYYFDF
tara:strand:- start:1746 stop:2045 length:300 start_codon:yes stop_codon:yes gene_type:complete